MFCVILACLFMSLTNGFLFDTSTHSTLGDSGITDKHYYDLLDLIMEERRSRRKIEHYVETLHTTILQLSTYVSEIKNETTDLKTNYSILLTEHFQFKNKMTSYESGSNIPFCTCNTNKPQENNETKSLEKLIQSTQNQVNLLTIYKEAQNQDFLALYNLTLSTQQDLIKSQLEAKSEIQKSRKYAENIFHNLNLSQSAINEARNQDILALYNITQSTQHAFVESQIEIKSEMQNSRNYAASIFRDLIQSQAASNEARIQDFVALYNLTVLNQHDLSLSQEAINTSLNHLQQNIETISENIGFTACGNSKLNDLVQFSSVGTQYGMRDLSTLQTKGQFICEKAGLYLVIASIMSKESNADFHIMINDVRSFGHVQIAPWHSAVNMFHTGTGSAVVHLNINDTISVHIGVDLAGGDYNCLSIIKIK